LKTGILLEPTKTFLKGETAEATEQGDGENRLSLIFRPLENEYFSKV